MLTTSGGVSNHRWGRAADISIVDGRPCGGTAHEPCWELCREAARIGGPDKVTELIYGLDCGPDADSFARSDHRDHVHVGFDGPEVERRGAVGGSEERC